MFEFTCHICLSQDRKLKPINHMYPVYKFIVEYLDSNEEGTNFMRKGSSEDMVVQMCWECEALLKKFLGFSQQALRAKQLLLQFREDCWKFNRLSSDLLRNLCMSNLKRVTKMNFDTCLTFQGKNTNLTNEEHIDIKPTITEIKIEVIKSPSIDDPVETVPLESNDIDHDHDETKPLAFNRLDCQKDVLPKIVNTFTETNVDSIMNVDVKSTVTNDNSQSVSETDYSVNKKPFLVPIPIEALRFRSNNTHTIFELACSPKDNDNLENDSGADIETLTYDDYHEDIDSEDTDDLKVNVMKDSNDESSITLNETDYGSITSELNDKNTITFIPKDIKDGIYCSAKADETLYNTESYLLSHYCQTLKMNDDEVNSAREEARLKLQYLDSPFKCDSCIIGFYNARLLTDHNNDNHTKKLNHDACRICEVYVRKRQMDRHLNAHRQRFDCNLCLFIEFDKRIMLKHIRAHTLVNPYSYKRTNSGYVPTRNLPHVKNNGTIYQCDQCLDTFEDFELRQSHINTVHKLMFECDQCHKRFANRDTLKTHLFSVTCQPLKPAKKKAKTPAERQREYRVRLKEQEKAFNIHKDKPTKQSRAAYRREYRLRQKLKIQLNVNNSKLNSGYAEVMPRQEAGPSEKKERQRRYREKNREKLKQLEAERRKRKLNSQTIAETSTSSNINGIDIYNEEITVLEMEKGRLFKQKRERQQRYRQQNREKLKKLAAERRKRKLISEIIAESSTSTTIDCIEIKSEAVIDDEISIDSLNVSSLEDTQNQFMEITERVICGDCQKSFRNRHSLEKHRLKRHKKGDFMCEFCKKVYVSYYWLKKHYKVIHNT